MGKRRCQRVLAVALEKLRLEEVGTAWSQPQLAPAGIPSYPSVTFRPALGKDAEERPLTYKIEWFGDNQERPLTYKIEWFIRLQSGAIGAPPRPYELRWSK